MEAHVLLDFFKEFIDSERIVVGSSPYCMPAL